MTERMSETLTPAHFPVDATAAWSVQVSDDESVELAVVETVASGDPRPFAVSFAGPLQPEIGQGTYALTHAEFGTFPLFIVPIARDADGMRYEAVFG